MRELSARVGLPFSTLSKLENGKMAMTYDKLSRLALALNTDIGALVAEVSPAVPPASVGRRSVTLRGEGLDAQSAQHRHLYPASELLSKRMVPIIIEVKARTVEERGGLLRHEGEEYLYVLKGAMYLCSDLYAPLRLEAGDSVYFDSGMAHAYIRAGGESCTVLTVCAGQGIDRFVAAAGESWKLVSHED